MPEKHEKFRYAKSTPVVGWGCRFDSLTELKYAISIMDDYEFLRERVVIWYERGNTEPIEYLRGNNSYYVPDFLIRSKTTGEAFLVEIKPRAFEGEDQLNLRTLLANKYIQKKGYDWKFKIVYDDEILLNEEQLEAYKECCRLKSKSSFGLWFSQYYRRFERTETVTIKNASPEARVRFIMFGETNQPGGWR